MSPNRWPLLAVAALVLAVVTGCGSDGADSGTPSPDSSPVIAAADDWDSLPTAEMNGRIFLKEGCLQLGDDAIFWPHGTRWDEDDQAVLLTDGSSVVVGQQFHGGGGVYDADTDFADLLGSDSAVEKLVDCLDRTHAAGARLLTP